MQLVARPLSAEAYAPFGHVLEAGAPPGKVVNLGTARRWDRRVPLENLRAGATLNASLFRAQPWRPPVAIALLEKHPASTQLFVPMNAARYLVIVARGAERPELSTLAAFVATGRQGVSYLPGTWHHPIVALDGETDFACFVHEDGTGDDCAEHPLTEPVEVLVDAPRP